MTGATGLYLYTVHKLIILLKMERLIATCKNRFTFNTPQIIIESCLWQNISETNLWTVTSCNGVFLNDVLGKSWPKLFIYHHLNKLRWENESESGKQWKKIGKNLCIWQYLWPLTPPGGSHPPWASNISRKPVTLPGVIDPSRAVSDPSGVSDPSPGSMTLPRKT